MRERRNLMISSKRWNKICCSLWINWNRSTRNVAISKPCYPVFSPIITKRYRVYRDSSVMTRTISRLTFAVKKLRAQGRSGMTRPQQFESPMRLPQTPSTVSYYPKDPRAVETICYSSLVDDYLQAKRSTDQSFWAKFGVRSPQVYFGSNTGVNRIFPGRTSREPGKYDPRTRPWYIAASSGPKNVILILDTSGTMNGRMVELRAAARQVISSLSTVDRVAIVAYATEARKIGRDSGTYLYSATLENKDILLAEIDQLQAIGSTNTYDAFVKAFEILDSSFDVELAIDCNTAILFLTDGKVTKELDLSQEASEQRVTDLVTTELSRFQDQKGVNVQLFTFTVDVLEDVELFPKALACATGGVWSRIVSDRDILDALTSYYQLFAFGLGTGANDGFTAWVEPYVFATGNVLGTTVSAPVYGRSGTHAVFLGVAGMDFPLALANRVLGIDDSVVELSESAFDRVIRASTARCPRLNLTVCELESYRRSGAAGDQALCTDSCQGDDFVTVEEDPCPNIDDFPRDLWINRLMEGMSYQDRVCCTPGDDDGSFATTCEMAAAPPSFSSSTLSSGAIGGIVVAGVLVVLGLVGLAVFWGWQQPKNTTPLEDVNIMRPPA